MPKANRSGFSGVTWDRRRGKWLVKVRLGCRRVPLGYLDDFDEARRVYLGAKLLLRSPSRRASPAGGSSSDWLIAAGRAVILDQSFSTRDMLQQARLG